MSKSRGMRNYSKALHFNLFPSSSLPDVTAEPEWEQKAFQGKATRTLFLGYRDVCTSVLIFTEPETARKLLDYRYATLPAGGGPREKFLDI